MTPIGMAVTAWEHVLRICEQAGIQGAGVLRDGNEQAWADLTADGGLPEARQSALAALADLTAHLRSVEQELKHWQFAAFRKIRTWDVLQSFHRAGESVEYLAEQYDLPVKWVGFVMFPENDLDARYGRPSDRTKTAKAEALDAEKRLREAEAQLAALAPYLQQIKAHVHERMALLQAMVPLDDRAKTVKFARTNELEQLLEVILRPSGAPGTER